MIRLTPWPRSPATIGVAHLDGEAEDIFRLKNGSHGSLNLIAEEKSCLFQCDGFILRDGASRLLRMRSLWTLVVRSAATPRVSNHEAPVA